MLRKVAISGIITAILVATPAFAHEGHDHSTMTKPDSSSSTDDSSKDSNKTEPRNDTTDKRSEQKDPSKKSEQQRQSQRDSVEAKKAKLHDELNKKSDEKKVKLEGRRLAQCQNRQKNINDSMAKSNSTGKERLGRLQQYEAKVRAFYTKQGLSSDAYNTASVKVDESEASAIAAIEVFSKQTFDCAKTDGDNPSSTVKAAGDAKRQALKQYREDLKALVSVVKQDFETSKTTATGSNT